MPKNVHKNVPSSYLVLIKDNKTLLLRRCNTGFQDGNYGLVSGHVDPDESFSMGMIREAYEEAGIKIMPENLVVSHVLHRCSGPGEFNQRVDVFFTTDTWKNDICNMEPHKCDDLSWFDLDNLPENTIPYIKQALECIVKGIPYSEYGWDEKIKK